MHPCGGIITRCGRFVLPIFWKIWVAPLSIFKFIEYREDTTIFCNNCGLMLLLLLLILATSPWGLSRLWGGGVPTLEIDHSGPRIRRLLLRSLIIGLAPLSPPAVRCPASPAVVLHPHSTWDHLPTRSSSVSVPAYQKNLCPPFPHLSLPETYFSSPLIPHSHYVWQIPITAAPMLPPNIF